MSPLPLLVASALPEAHHGITTGGVLGIVSLTAALLAVAGLLWVEFYWKSRIARTTYRWLLLLGLFVLPGVSLMGTSGEMFERLETVESCNSCHVMHTFVDDMKNPESASLAARHFRSAAIPDKQCYGCHVGYGFMGTLEAKRDGFRHWLLFVTQTWPNPIAHRGTFPNQNCLNCHAQSPKFKAVDSHKALGTLLSENQANCFTCHGLPHPSRPSRTASSHQP